MAGPDAVGREAPDPGGPAMIDELAELVLAVRLDHPVRVGIDGITASGKSTLARSLSASIEAAGRPVAQVSMDGYHRRRQIRYGRHDRYSADGYYEDAYDFDALAAYVLHLLGPGGDRRYRPAIIDLAADVELDEARVEMAPDGLLVVDGTFLQRPPVGDLWDVVVYVDVPYQVARGRGIERDAGHLGGPEAAARLYDLRYHRAAHRYDAEMGPRQRAHVVVDNSDVSSPRLVRQWPSGG